MRTANKIAAGVLLAFCGGSAQAQVAISEDGHFADVNGARLYYEERGTGEPLFLLHNFFATAKSWDAYADAWASQYRVISWDMRGHGRSTNPDTSDVFLHEQVAHDLFALMDHLEIDRAKVVGASSGAVAVLHAATLKPARLDAIVLVGGFAYREVAAREHQARAPFLQDAETLATLNDDHGEERMRQLALQFRRAATLYGDPAFTPDILATITARTLIVQGDNDPYVSVSQAVEMLTAIPHARLWIVPNGFHLVHRIPENRDDFLRRVSEFLEGQWEEEAR